MNIKYFQTLQQATDFLHSSDVFTSTPTSKSTRYQWIEKTLRHFRYARRSKFE